jgi:Fe-S-cluster containining protein
VEPGTGATSLREATWLACAAKSCCHAAVIVPTGRDVWRIARTLEVPPWTFLRYFATPQPTGDAFALDASERRYRLVLRKRDSRKKQPPCIFLTKTRHGHHRCGLGDLRPAACRSFPADLIGGVLCMGNDLGCTCRTWTMVDVEVAEARAAVLQREAEAAEYRAVVAEWNRRVMLARTGQDIDFFAFCDFLIDAYDAIAARDGAR